MRARATNVFGVGDAPRQFGKRIRQLRRLDGLVCQLGGAADQRTLGTIELRLAVAVDTHVENDRRARTIRQQAGCTLGEHGWIETCLAIGQVLRCATLPRLRVERVAIVDEPGDIGNGVVQQHVAARHLDVKGLIEIGRRRPGRA